jgi:hypothetical protein
MQNIPFSLVLIDQKTRKENHGPMGVDRVQHTLKKIPYCFFFLATWALPSSLVRHCVFNDQPALRFIGVFDASAAAKNHGTSMLRT